MSKVQQKENDIASLREKVQLLEAKDKENIRNK